MTPDLGQKAPETTTPNADAGRLLVVDDNEMNRDMLSRRLARRGHEVVTAEDGAVALELIGTDAFDVILLDIMMPGIDGLDHGGLFLIS